MDDQPVRDLLQYLAPIPASPAPSGRLSKPVRAIVFDIYGTLFISGCGDIGSAENMALPVSALSELMHRFGIDASPEEMTRRLHQAIREAHARRKAEGIAHPEIAIDAVWQDILGWRDMDRVRRLALAYEWTVNPCYPMPGLEETLRILRHRGLIMGLVSNAQFFTPLLFKWFLGAYPERLGFDAALTVYSYRCGRAKPSEKLFRQCQDIFDQRRIPPRAVAYLGNDMRNDILPAARTGWQTVLFAGDRRSLRLHRDQEACRKIQPDLVITALRQLLAWIP